MCFAQVNNPLQYFKPIFIVFVFFKVRELTETLERSLNFGSAVKKPAGGVSLHFQGNGNDNSEPPRATAQQSSGRKVKSMHSWENSPSCFIARMLSSC